MEHRRGLALALGLALAGANHLGAQCIYNLSTGWDNAAGQVAAIGGPDDQYTVADDQGGAAGPATTGGPGVFPIPPWVANTDRSLWVSSDPSSVDLPAIYTYEVKFNLDAVPELVDLVLLGRWTSDDTGLDVVINGASTGQTSAGFQSYTELAPGLGKGLFVAGENTVQFKLQNGGVEPNPTGLRVDACVGLPPPEDREVDISGGFDQDNLVTLADGADDLDWTVTGPAGSGIGPRPAVVLDHAAFPIPPWLPRTTQSKWIGIGTAASEGPGGLYSYAIKVSIPDRFDAEVSELKGRFAADDSVTDIKVNGQSTGVTGAGFGAYTPIPAGAGKGLFQNGDNTVEFTVENGGLNPTGLRVDAEVTVGKLPPPAAECIYRVSTGWDNDAGMVLDPLGGLDDEYTVDDGLGAGPQPAITFPGDRFPVPPWLANNDTSVWIAPTPDTNAAPGTFIYEIAFNLPEDLDFRKIALVGRWATDDPGQDVIVNDTPTGIGAGGFLDWTVFPPGAGNGLFLPGRNSVKFQVLNGGGPTGLRVDGCVALQTADNRDYDLSTGFDEETLVVLSNGQPDPGYILSGPGIPAPRPATVIIDDQFPVAPAGPWVASSVQSKWIGPTAGSEGDPGAYSYKTTVNLDPSLDPELTSIVGSFATDDVLTDIFVNNSSTGANGQGLGFDKLNPLPAGVGRGLFQTGDNTIEFMVENGGAAAGPTGLRFDGQLAICPLPPGGAPRVQPNTVFSIDTGFSEELGATIENGRPDDNYELIGPDGSGICRIEAKVVFDDQFPIGPWFGTTPRSKWIGTGEAASGGPPGNYTFRTRVVLPDGFDAAGARLIGAWSSDNNAPDILINGTSTGIAGGGNFTQLAPFPDGAGLGLFQPGENLIEFVVFNAPPGVNPVGLRVEGVVGAGSVDPADLSTGVSNRGIGLLPPGVEDDSFTVAGGGPPSRAKVIRTLGAGWAANSDASQWVGLDGTTSVGPAGEFIYEVQFQPPPDRNPFRQAIAGRWAAAGRGVDVVLNGTSLRLAAAGPAALADFPAGTGKGLIQNGLNTLRFVVQNDSPGPTGLRVEAGLATVVEANPLDISTGFDEAAGTAISDADPVNLQLDDDYLVTDPTTFADLALVLGPGSAPIPPWIPSSDSSRWIGPVAATSAAPGQYRYDIEVSLTREQAADAYLLGVWATDDHGDDVLINDQPTGIQNNGGFAGYTPFPPDAGLGLFSEGTNTITFLVSNGGAAGNPHGLRVDAVVAIRQVVEPKASFRRGDVDANGLIDVTDAIRSLGYQFLGEARPECLEAADTDDNGVVDISDAISNLGYQFLGAAPPADPGPTNCGPDRNEEEPDLGCDKPCV